MKIQAILILIGILIAFTAYANETDYTTRNFTIASCELFANDVYHAAYSFTSGDQLTEVLKLIDQMPIADSRKTVYSRLYNLYGSINLIIRYWRRV